MNTSNKTWPIFSKKEVEISSKILRSGKVNYWTGSQGKEFELEFAKYVGVNYAIAVANGTLALELAFLALGISRGDEVIVPSRTYIASASSVVMVGAKPVIADINIDSGNIDLDAIKKVRTKKTKAIVVVHLAGWPCDMRPIIEYAKKNKLLIIEDCAQAHGASYNGKKVGSFGDAAAFSFCQDKIMTTAGEGGIVLFKRKKDWSKAWSLKDHGKNYSKVNTKNQSNGFKWLVDSFGSNYRMTEIQAAIGRYQLSRLDYWVKIRNRNSKILDECFKNIPVIRDITIPKNIVHARYKYYAYIDTVKLKKGVTRDSIMNDFNKKGIPCFSGSCSEIYLEDAFKNKGYIYKKRHKIAKKLGETSIVFLVDPTKNVRDMENVCKVAKNIFNKASA